MPELPEVETTRLGLLAGGIPGKTVTAVTIIDGRLRLPIPRDLPSRLTGARLMRIERRGKYLLFAFDSGTLLVHFGMSGSLRLGRPDTPRRLHDRLDIRFGDKVLRLRDPRRFGLALWADADGHERLSGLGVEPLEGEFDGAWLYRATRRRSAPIKIFLMDGRRIAGIGNIYASESLFRAGIDPRSAAGDLSRRRCDRLAAAIKETLNAAIEAGGSSLRDYVAANGKDGRFQQGYFVYGRADVACRRCGARIRRIRLGQRSTFYCPRCQR
jgi:formamidopyrimidine-DNA glycosylase